MMRPIHRLYAWHLRSRLAGAALPRHVALVMDGNRRWARQAGFDDAGVGHRHGGERLRDVLGWCAEAGIEDVTVYVASVDNVRKRAPEEVAGLMRLIEEAAAASGSGALRGWRLHLAGDLDVLPESTRSALRRAERASAERSDTGRPARFHLTVRALLADEARAGASLDDVAERLTVDDIAARLYTAGRPDPDLVIRTSGERRTSGFLLWQAANSQLYFCDVYWPGFRRIDFLRALRSYAARARP
jgi:short-chain Z-isoprenyl diphosphate synthase